MLAPWHKLGWGAFLPYVLAGNVVVAALAWIIVWEVMRWELALSVLPTVRRQRHPNPISDLVDGEAHGDDCDSRTKAKTLILQYHCRKKRQYRPWGQNYDPRETTPQNKTDNCAYRQQSQNVVHDDPCLMPTRNLIAASLDSIVHERESLHQTKIGLGSDALRRWSTIAIREVEDSAAHPAVLGVELGNFIACITWMLTVKIDEGLPLPSSPAFCP
jgi:hypothetical protein